MAKTNYTKVDAILENELRRMTVQHDLAASELHSKPKKTSETPAEPSSEPQTVLDQAQSRLVASLQRDLKKLRLEDHREMYASLAIKKADLRKKIESPEKLTPEDWETIKQIKEKIDKYRAELKTKIPGASDDAIVEGERQKHINKRFNVNEKWLPLH